MRPVESFVSWSLKLIKKKVLKKSDDFESYWGYILGVERWRVFIFFYFSQRFFLLFGMEEEKSFLKKALLG